MLISSRTFSDSFPIVPLGKVVDFLDNLRKPVTASDRTAGEYPYYGANGLQGTINDYIFDEPLVLLAEDGGFFGMPDKTIAYQVSGKCWVNNHAHVLRPKQGVDIRYLLNVLQKYDVTPYTNGTTRAKLTKGSAERISSDETSNENDGTGEEVVDVAEYYGASTIKQASRISYHQLKHSYAVGDPWTLSAFKKTLQGFFKRYAAYKQEAEDTSRQEVEFTFTTNRPVSQDVHDLFARIKQNTLQDADAQKWSQIKGYLNTQDDALAREFLLNFHIDDANDLHWRQRGILIEELQGYIAGSDSESADQLWRLVVEKASPEYARNPKITREDVLRFLNTNETNLFPAPCRIENTEGYFARVQEEEYRQRILDNGQAPTGASAQRNYRRKNILHWLAWRAPCL